MDEWGLLSESLKRIAVVTKETGISIKECTKSVEGFMNNLFDEDLIDFIYLIEINNNLSWCNKIKLKCNLKRCQNKKKVNKGE